MGYALVFSGQGGQHPGMLPWLAHDETLAALERAIGGDWREQLANPAKAWNNRPTQLLITATACAAWGQLQGRLPPPDIIAGYSVGEIPAFATAGVFGAQAALSVASTRAACMDAAAVGTATGLLGVTGATQESLMALCARFDLDVAIRVDPRSVVLGGTLEGLSGAATAGTAYGWRCTSLKVSLASHTRWMRTAVCSFELALSGTEFLRPTRPLVSNARGRVRTVDDARAALAQQLAHTVHWDDCMDQIAAHGVQAVLEIGPGQALAKIWNERYSAVPARSVDEFRSAESIVAWLNRHLSSH